MKIRISSRGFIDFLRPSLILIRVDSRVERDLMLYTYPSQRAPVNIPRLRFLSSSVSYTLAPVSSCFIHKDFYLL